MKPVKKRELVERLEQCYAVSERRACQALRFPRSSHRYQSCADEQAALRLRIKDIASTRVVYGYRRIHTLLLREGWKVNHKRVYRIYCQECLSMRVKPPKRRTSCLRRVERPVATSPNASWSMDFMADQLFDGTKLRLFTLVDNFTRESLAVEVGPRFSAEAVCAVLDQVVVQRGKPQSIRVDNGPEFTSKALDLWAYSNGVTLDFSRPGKPTDNAYIESFNSLVRKECLNQHWFLSLEDARDKTQQWKLDYNQVRPHGSLGNQTPEEIAQHWAKSAGPKKPNS